VKRGQAAILDARLISLVGSGPRDVTALVQRQDQARATVPEQQREHQADRREQD
jgi:hypothetical protein